MLSKALLAVTILSGATLAATLAATGAQAGTRHGASDGLASWYKSGHHTANGERFNPNGLTAAHRSLPFGTRVRVENTRTGRTVIVRINDRGPFVRGRVIDLSLGSARALGMGGTAYVRLVRL